MNDQQDAAPPQTEHQGPLPQVIAEHLDWVYGAALRQVRDHHLAEDVTQAVFLLLTRKAAFMPRETRLTGWLFQAVRYCSYSKSLSR